MAFNEADIVNALATEENGISALKHSFAYSDNPDNITNAHLACILHYIPVFVSEPRAHPNIWTNTITVRSILFAVPREGLGGKVKFLDNDAIRWGKLYREHMQSTAVINNLYSKSGNATKVFLERGEYGTGGPLLTFGDIQYVGWVFTHIFKQN